MYFLLYVDLKQVYLYIRFARTLSARALIAHYRRHPGKSKFRPTFSDESKSYVRKTCISIMSLLINGWHHLTEFIAEATDLLFFVIRSLGKSIMFVVFQAWCNSFFVFGTGSFTALVFTRKEAFSDDRNVTCGIFYDTKLTFELPPRVKYLVALPSYIVIACKLVMCFAFECVLEGGLKGWWDFLVGNKICLTLVQIAYPKSLPTLNRCSPIVKSSTRRPLNNKSTLLVVNLLCYHLKMKWS